MRTLLLIILIFGLIGSVTPVAEADEGWVIERLYVEFDVQPDGSINVREEIDVDFRGLQRHGILRDLVTLQAYDQQRNRRYEIGQPTVTSAEGRVHQVQISSEEAVRQFRIGDPDREITGRETYRIAYTLRGALNGFPGHDELYWNTVGTWPVRIEQASFDVRVPDAGMERAQCFQGPSGSTEPCRTTVIPELATYVASRPLEVGEQVTIVAGLRKGAVTAPSPILVDRPRDLTRFFDRTPVMLGILWGGLAAAFGGVGALWWWIGRDRRYVSLHYLSQETADERVPFFGAKPIAVEFQPPDGLRPAQMGLLMDERADTLDITATIVDLAVRGYLRITEIKGAGLLGTGWFAKEDWQLDRLKPADGHLLEYERIVFDGIFGRRDSRTLSSLKNKFHEDLARAKKALYQDAMSRQWFHRNPDTVRTMTRVAGLVVVGGGVALMIWLGHNWGYGLAGLPVFAAGLLLLALPRAMPRRTAAGREAMRRCLGFARYVETAEKHQQAFAERASIFTEYLPYAVAFAAVDRWAKAFEDIDLGTATRTWYQGGSTFDGRDFSSRLGRFGSTVSTTMSSTPGGSGSSGFGGGSSGGGGGGGGGGSW